MIAGSSTARFGELTIKGFRRLRDVRLELRPLSVLIGANGTGKTSLLDVLTVLANSAQGRLRATMSQLSGLANNITYGHAKELGLGISSKIRGEGPLEYQLLLRVQGVGYAIREETLIRKGRTHSSTLRYVSSDET